jgi:hypothetical protein
MEKDVENKVKGIIGMYNFYKYQLNTVQRVGLLTLWIELCVKKEEYEVAAGLQKEMDKIVNGDEQYFIIAPSVMLDEEKEIMEKTITESLKDNFENKKKTKRLRFINYWGTNVFEFFRFSLNDFKLIIFNLGFEYK